jgi:hypothetical protein
MEDIRHVFFSFYYINENQEIERVVKNKYTLEHEGVLTQHEFMKQLIKHKRELQHRVVLKDILLYHNQFEPIGFFLSKTPENCLSKIHSLESIHFDPVYSTYADLTHIYVLYQMKSNLHILSPSSVNLTKKIRYTHGLRGGMHGGMHGGTRYGSKHRTKKNTITI